MQKKEVEQIKKILVGGIVIAIGLIIFKYIPMFIFGRDILFDASSHVAWTIFLLYIVWFFIDQNKSWRIPYFILSIAILTIISIQRIVTNNHNLFGLFLGFLIGIFGIAISQYKSIGNKIKF